MLNELINEYRDKIEYIEATVNPSNNASKSLFKKLSKSLDAPFSEAEFIKEGELEENHEAEILLQVGKIEK
jgi:L-2,4-diaminobutyric acid acetyltransferase